MTSSVTPLGLVRMVDVAPVVEATPDYAAGDLIGGKLTIADASFVLGGGLIQSAILIDQAAQSADIDLIIFNDDPSGTTFTENAALDIADADMLKIAGVIQFLSTGWVAAADNSVNAKHNLAIDYRPNSNGLLYGAMIARDAFNAAATTDLKLRLGILVGRP